MIFYFSIYDLLCQKYINSQLLLSNADNSRAILVNLTTGFKSMNFYRCKSKYVDVRLCLHIAMVISRL